MDVVWGILVIFCTIKADVRPSITQIQPDSHSIEGISRLWGQYSPYFAVDSRIPSSTPDRCNITFVQVLSRHGARDPTVSRWMYYSNLIKALKSNVTHFSGVYSFLETYDFELGVEQLTELGRAQMLDSGEEFFGKYRHLTDHFTPFVRASGQRRVIESAEKWIQGFLQHRQSNVDIPLLVISEKHSANNTLSHDLCYRFRSRPLSLVGYYARKEFAIATFAGLQRRLNTGLPGAQLSLPQIIALMDLCPFETVASKDSSVLSPFCYLFSEREWRAYDYYQTLGKFYGHGGGNPLGATQGVGFVNELLARLTDTPVIDQTTTNHTLDSNPTTFPLGRKLYADFSHDNDMTGILAALGLYNATEQLSNSTITEADSDEAAGYSAAWTVPFAGRIYIEKMTCEGADDELVRVVVNDRVVPLVNCDVDDQGRCTLSAFIKSQSFVRAGGKWEECAKDLSGLKHSEDGFQKPLMP